MEHRRPRRAPPGQQPASRRAHAQRRGEGRGRRGGRRLQRRAVRSVARTVRVVVSVADVSRAVAVEILLARIRRQRAVVHERAEPVAVRVVDRVAGAGVAGVAHAVVVAVRLARVGDGGAVVLVVRHAVAVAVLGRGRLVGAEVDGAVEDARVAVEVRRRRDVGVQARVDRRAARRQSQVERRRRRVHEQRVDGDVAVHAEDAVAGDVLRHVAEDVVVEELRVGEADPQTADVVAGVVGDDVVRGGRLVLGVRGLDQGDAAGEARGVAGDGVVDQARARRAAGDPAAGARLVLEDQVPLGGAEGGRGLVLLRRVGVVDDLAEGDAPAEPAGGVPRITLREITGRVDGDSE